MQSNCHIRLELSPASEKKEEDLERLDAQLMAILHEVMKDRPAIRYFNLLETE